MRTRRVLEVALLGLVVGSLAGGGEAIAAHPFAAPAVHGSQVEVETKQDNNFCLAEGHVFGRTIIISQCSTADSTHWALTDDANGRNVLVGGDGKCLDSGKRAIGTELQEKLCTFSGNQQFNFKGDGHLVVRTSTGKLRCITVAGVTQDAAVFLNKCSSSSAQLFLLAQ